MLYFLGRHGFILLTLPDHPNVKQDSWPKHRKVLLEFHNQFCLRKKLNNKFIHSELSEFM